MQTEKKNTAMSIIHGDFCESYPQCQRFLPHLHLDSVSERHVELIGCYLHNTNGYVITDRTRFFFLELRE